MSDPDLLYACYRSGQMTERQWQQHLAADEELRQWLQQGADRRPRLAAEPVSGPLGEKSLALPLN